MTAPEDRPTVGERYGRAMQSSQLQVTADKPGDVDLLIAAGWVQEGLGCRLYRLRLQFDGMNRKDAGRPTGASLVGANALTMMRPAKLELDAFALIQAARAGLEADQRAVMLIAGAALSVWLSPNCDHCKGRKFHGELGQPREQCSHCHGFGRRNPRLGRTEEEHQFGLELHWWMDHKINRVETKMREFMRHREAVGTKRRAAAEQALSQRLGDLRSTAAQED